MIVSVDASRPCLFSSGERVDQSEVSCHGLHQWEAAATLPATKAGSALWWPRSSISVHHEGRGLTLTDNEQTHLETPAEPEHFYGHA